ncbi:diadenylate cyclase CdaA [Roseburia sp. AM59-24XD]|uniref:diadenylate cyclase CdaA n=1 Tax=Roseburia sp. AM59-24XD TaxID=2293138 RepID=UPI000E5070E3|nr:diadenylate cyclase CdaA [Roseburia sp. AM59-24XD]RHP85589.1 TIGR00159 family protein [Roseburia sp. AM59-24XD]
MNSIVTSLKKYIHVFDLPKVSVIDVLEIVILAFVIYHVALWIKNTRAWTLLRGIIVLLACYVIAYILGMNVIVWIFERTISIGITALMIVFQPELRRALEELGQKNIVSTLIPFDDTRNQNERFSERSINEIVKATVEMAKVKTGALIIIEKDIDLSEYERTGIELDSTISSQLLINIFEHNTPLHDGAVIIRGDRIVSATCYLPLSDNMGLSKELGTRHRAGVGISEVTDSLTIIVSEETGRISVAVGGKLLRNIDGDLLKKKLTEMQGKSGDEVEKKRWKGLRRN